MRAIRLALALALAGCATVPRPPGGEARVRFDARHVIAERARGHATVDGPVRVASVSKLVTAIAVLRLVETGRLDLDADVSPALGWRLRNPAFPDVPVTLRMLLSHTSGLVDVGDDYAVPLAQSLRATVDARHWLPHRPGSWFHYTNLNYPLIATIVERATGERFDAAMARLVLQPLGLDACFNWTTCSDTAVARAVVLYDVQGHAVKDELHGARPACPVAIGADQPCDLGGYRPGDNGALFAPQGGLRISMRDLARIGQLLLGDGVVGGVRLLTPASVRLMRTPVWTFAGDNGDSEGGFYCRFGLGVQTLATPGCRDDPAGDRHPRFGHAGEAYGLRSGLWIDPVTRRGVAFFRTAAPTDAGARSAFSAAEEAALP